MRGITRRFFLKEGGVALLAVGLPPSFVARTLFARTGAGGRKTLICVFQRGAVDGLAMVVPFGEPAFSSLRRSIAIPAPSTGGGGTAMDLDGFFGLHPALEPLMPLWRRSELAVVHACGSPHPTRSHFEAQDYMETAVPGDVSVTDGWLNRMLVETSCRGCRGRRLADGPAHAADHALAQSGLTIEALRGVAIGAELPLALRGGHPALAIPDLDRFGVAGGDAPTIESAFRELYRGPEGDRVAVAAGESFDALDLLRRADPARYRPRAGVEYPGTPFGRSLRQIAQLVKADVGLEVAFTDLGGWDTHVAQGAVEGALAARLRELALGIRALHDDLADRMADVVVLTMSEFGRTVAENGSGGTDHGHGNCMLVLGGEVAGGRVYGEWPGLEPEQLHDGRDLAVTTDYRAVFAEVAARHLGVTDLSRVLPGYPVDPSAFRGVLAAPPRGA